MLCYNIFFSDNKKKGGQQKKMKYISNAFSTKMLNPKTNPTISMMLSTYEEIVKEKNELISSIGHQNIADHVKMEKNRINIQLEQNDILYLVNEIKTDENQKEYTYWKITIKERGESKK